MVTAREKFLLWKALEFDIHRYLRANEWNLSNYSEKFERHKNITEILIEYSVCKDHDEIRGYPKIFDAVHRYLQDILTDRMDEVIGFPINEPVYDFNNLSHRFFGVIVDHLDEIHTLIEKTNYEKNY